VRGQLACLFTAIVKATGCSSDGSEWHANYSDTRGSADVDPLELAISGDVGAESVKTQQESRKSKMCTHSKLSGNTRRKVTDIHIHMHTRTHTHTHTRTHTHVCMHVCVNVCMHTCIMHNSFNLLQPGKRFVAHFAAFLLFSLSGAG